MPEKKLSLIYTTLREELIRKAKALNADAIVGFSCDIDEISAKSKSMFMISGVGTAVKFKNHVSSETVQELNKKKLLNHTNILDLDISVSKTSFLLRFNQIQSIIED